MSYLSKMLEMDKAVDAAKVGSPQQVAYFSKDDYEKRKEELDVLGEMIATSVLPDEDKETFLGLIEKYKTNLQTGYNKKTSKNNPNETLKYLVVALLSGGAGFGLGWHAKNAYEGYKSNRIKEVMEIVKTEMEKNRQKV